jgi:hypothetical protein
MLTTSTDNNNDKNFEIPLELNDELNSKGIIQKFVINKRHKYIKIELTNKYEQSTIVVPIINVINWPKFQESIKKELNRKGVYDKEHIRLIQNTIDDNHELVIGRTIVTIQQLEEKQEERDKEYEILIQKLIEENPNLTPEDWFKILLEKRLKLNSKIDEYFPDVSLLVDFELSIKKILNIEDITLPFMGIVFAVPSSLKTAFFKFKKISIFIL